MSERKKFDLSSLIDLDEDLWPIVREELRATVGDEKYNAFVKLLASPDKPDPALKEAAPEPKGDAVAWLIERNGKLCLPLLHTHEDVERYVQLNPNEKLEALYTHPDPTSSELIRELVEALTQCRDQFAFYADEHWRVNKVEKAETNFKFKDLAATALDRAKAYGSGS